MKILNTKERSFLKTINGILWDNSYLGDDCAILKNFNLAITQDTLVEGVHFDFNFITPFELGKKAVLVNLSDLVAAGAKPLYITVSLSGKLSDNVVCELYKGINDICKKQNVKVIGGDLTVSKETMISICALGDIKKRNISSSKNAKEGYIVAVKGFFGSSAKGLENLQKGLTDFRQEHIEPEIFFETSDEIALKTKHPYAMKDSSDGLLDCLAQISEMSSVGIEIDYDKIPKKINDKKLVLTGGEDYSLVICADKKDFKKIKGLTKIGEVTAKKGVFVNGEDWGNKDWAGYEHFK